MSVLVAELRTQKDVKAERRRPSCHAGRSLDRSASSERNIVAVKVATAFALPSESDALDVFAYDGPFPAA